MRFVSSLAVLATSIFVGCALGASLIPLSPSTYAFKRGNASSNVDVAIYIDLSCSDTAAVWGTLNKVYDTYKSSVNFMYHVFPLPYHQYAFVLSKAAHVVEAYGDDGAVFHYFDTVFANQAQILNSATADMTYDEVVAFIGQWATDGTGVTDEEYVLGMKNSDIEMNTRYMWKYCTLHGVFGTPLYAINGIMNMGLSTYDQWLLLMVAVLMMGTIVLALMRAYCCTKIPQMSEEDDALLERPSRHKNHHYGSIRPSHACCDHEL